jgi:hypothetical protein
VATVDGLGNGFVDARNNDNDFPIAALQGLGRFPVEGTFGINAVHGGPGEGKQGGVGPHQGQIIKAPEGFPFSRDLISY